MKKRTRGMQDERDARQVGCRTSWKQDRRGAGQERWRKEGMKGRRDDEKEGKEIAGGRKGVMKKRRVSGIEGFRT